MKITLAKEVYDGEGPIKDTEGLNGRGFCRSGMLTVLDREGASGRGFRWSFRRGVVSYRRDREGARMSRGFRQPLLTHRHCPRASSLCSWLTLVLLLLLSLLCITHLCSSADSSVIRVSSLPPALLFSSFIRLSSTIVSYILRLYLYYRFLRFNELMFFNILLSLYPLVFSANPILNI